MSILYRVDTIKNRAITTIEAENRQEAERKAWRTICGKGGVRLANLLREEGILIYPDRGGCWSKSEGI
jgi:uncharacterized protein